MNRRTLIICSAMALLPLASVTADESPDGLRELLGADTYEAAGLDLLSEQERSVLEAWVRNQVEQRPVPMPAATASYSSARAAPTAMDHASPARTAAAQAEPQMASDAAAQAPARAGTRSMFGIDFSGSDSMESAIDGEFDGFDGETVFHLQNGTIWEQIDDGRLILRSPEMDPEVLIERGYFGYRMRIEGHNRRVQVRRLE